MTLRFFSTCLVNNLPQNVICPDAKSLAAIQKGYYIEYHVPRPEMRLSIEKLADETQSARCKFYLSRTKGQALMAHPVSLNRISRPKRQVMCNRCGCQHIFDWIFKPRLKTMCVMTSSQLFNPLLHRTHLVALCLVHRTHLVALCLVHGTHLDTSSYS